MKRNITLELDAGLLREACRLAAEQGTSVSALLAGQLQRIIENRRGYGTAKKRALLRLRRGFDLNRKSPISRDELHERKRQTTND